MIHISKKEYFYSISALILIVAFSLLFIPKENKSYQSSILTAKVIYSDREKLTVQDSNSIIYTFSVEKNNYKAGDNLIIEYTGILNKDTEFQKNNLISISPVSQDEEDITPRITDGIFSDFEILAQNKLKEMTLEEKIGQILLVRYSKDKAQESIGSYKVGGFVFFENDFANKTENEVQSMINKLQSMSKIPLLTSTDEEGGTVVRVSSNKNLFQEPFKSPRELYLEGGFDLITKDTKEKSTLLKNLGLNVNLAPVVDVSTNKSDYMYERTLGEDTQLTSEYAQTVIEASKDNSVSYVLKHFPGYGNNDDTHQGEVIDTRTFDEIESNDLPPFEAGISSGAEAILVSHNIVKSIDEDNPASLSASIHNLLRNSLDFTGIIMTDDLSMAALSSIDKPAVKAIQAGNDIIITTDYQESFNQIKDAVNDGNISEEQINSIVERILSWKYYKGLMYEKTK